FIHANPYHRYVGVFIDLVSKISDVRLWKIAVAASVYTILRFVEAYGLWYALPWAEWLAATTGAIYIPFECAELIHRVTWFRLLVLVVNLVIVLYMLYLRLDALEKRRAAIHAWQQAVMREQQSDIGSQASGATDQT